MYVQLRSPFFSRFHILHFFLYHTHTCFFLSYMRIFFFIEFVIYIFFLSPQIFCLYAWFVYPDLDFVLTFCLYFTNALFFALFLFPLSFLFVPFGLLLRVFVSSFFSFSPFISSQYLWLSLFLTIPFFFLLVCLFALSTRIAGIQIKQIEFFLSFFPHSMGGILFCLFLSFFFSSHFLH